MNTNQQKKRYSYFSFHKPSKYGHVEGKVYNMKIKEFEKDGTKSKVLSFGLICSNIDKKVEYVFDAKPKVSVKNPETIFINCAVFGDLNVERFGKFIHDNDYVGLTGLLSMKDGGSLDLRVYEGYVKFYASSAKQNSTDDSVTFMPENEYASSEEDSDEIPF